MVTKYTWPIMRNVNQMQMTRRTNQNVISPAIIFELMDNYLMQIFRPVRATITRMLQNQVAQSNISMMNCMHQL